ncbi:hypothetical protein [Oleiharenicola lentus]|uniref:hypothetical protein n=1 Tax=Oleiharenicola lentus TaxID=2508720 RepID=UPI003F67322E
MLLFKRILNFTQNSVSASNKRNAERYNVGEKFPFKATVSLIRHDEFGVAVPNDDIGQDWVGTLNNISATGASIQLHSAAIASRGQACCLKLSLDDYVLEIPGTVAYFRTYPHHTVCGFSYGFDYFETQKAYMQILEAVALGASLEAVKAKEVKQDAAGLLKEVYKGKGESQLTIWRKDIDRSIHSFEFRMSDYGVRWTAGLTELETYSINERATASRKNGLTKAQHDEVSWLFCLAVPNLPKSVPADVREFLDQLVA